MKKLLISLILCGLAHATTTVTGNLKDLSTGTIATNAFVRVWLRGCGGNTPRVNGTALISPSNGNQYFKDFKPNSSGAISGTVYSTRDAAGTGNGEIECGGSLTAVWYGVQVFGNGIGGPEMPVHAKNGTSLDLTNVTPITTNPVVTAPTGDSTYARIDSGNMPFTGSVTGKAFGNVLYVGPGGYSTIAAAESAAGANKTLIMIQSNYAGTECGSPIANVVEVDLRGNGTIICDSNNTTEYMFNDTVVNSLMKQQMNFTGDLNTNGSILVLWPITTVNNGISHNTIIDGVSPEALLTGTLTGTIPIISGTESAGVVRSTGGAVTNAYGNQGYVADSAGRTTPITNAIGDIGIGCNALLGSPKPTNCYGGYFNKQGTQAATRNYALGVEANMVMRYDSATLSKWKIDGEDNGGVVRDFIFLDGANNATHIQALNAQGTYLDDSGTTTRIRLTSAGVRIGDNGTPTAALDVSGNFKLQPNNTIFLQEGTGAGANASFEECFADSSTHTLKCSYNNGTFFSMPQTVGTGTAAMTTAGIATGACGTTVTVAVTGVLTTDTIDVSRNAAATNANGGNLILNWWPTAGNVNFNYCNPSAGTVTPTAMTVNFGVRR